VGLVEKAIEKVWWQSQGGTPERQKLTAERLDGGVIALERLLEAR